jgi:hypothetical protein
MYSDFLSPIVSGNNDFQCWAKLQAQAWQACVNAGIAINPLSNPLLTPIVTGDNSLQKFQKVQAFLTLLANNISGSGVGAAQAGNPAVTTGVTSLAVVFATPFSAPPSVVCNLVPSGGGNVIAVAPTSITDNGFTADWGFAIPAGYTLSWIATPTTQ